MSDYYRGAYDGASRDTIKLGEGLNKEDVQLSLQGNDLLVNFDGNSEDQLVLKDFMSNNTINNFEFADGTSYSRAELLSSYAVSSSAEDNTHSLYESNDEFNAGDGNDVIY